MLVYRNYKAGVLLELKKGRKMENKRSINE